MGDQFCIQTTMFKLLTAATLLAVADDYSKANFKKAETQDAGGNVAGSFTIALPDGRLQTTTYTADLTNGFVAEVTYEGTAVYPPEPAAGYGHAAPAYKPAPYAG